VSTLILRCAVRLLVPLSLIFGAFIYFKGHQSPGGGFVSGLVISVALVLLRMAEGPALFDRALPCRERTWIAIGLALAAGTGLGAMCAGLPFLTSAHGHLPLPGGGHLEWASVMIFDLGVALVVAGVVVGMIHSLMREVDEAAADPGSKRGAPRS